MTRTAIGALAAAAFALGILAGVFVPGSLASWDHGRLMASHMGADQMAATEHMADMPMMQMMGGSGTSMPMDAPMSGSDHAVHHAGGGFMR